MTILAIIVLFFSVLILFLVEPTKSLKKQYSLFAGRNYAHRGLHSEDKLVPENSIPAFEKAAELGYGIELDVRLTGDGELVVFHDDNLKRVCGAEGKVSDMTFNQLQAFNLCGTQFKIPLFSQVLETVDGKVPLIVELKTNGNDYAQLCSKVWDELSSYHGLYCIESFDPRAVGWFKKHHANVYRGQLTSSYKDLSKSASKPAAFVVSNLLSNVVARPHFIAYSMEKMSPLCLFCMWLGARKFVWVARDKGKSLQYEADNDGVIFEFYQPKPKYYKEL